MAMNDDIILSGIEASASFKANFSVSDDEVTFPKKENLFLKGPAGIGKAGSLISAFNAAAHKLTNDRPEPRSLEGFDSKHFIDPAVTYLKLAEYTKTRNDISEYIKEPPRIFIFDDYPKTLPDLYRNLSGHFGIVGHIQTGKKFEIPKPLSTLGVQRKIEMAPAESELVGPIRPYNAAQPFVMVNIGKDDPSRGDSHGFIGIAERVALKIGAKLHIVDQNDICGVDVDNIGATKAEPSEREGLKRHFEIHGYPDFYFSREPSNASLLMQDGGGNGVIIRGINECLAENLLSVDKISRYPENIVSHHLTPEKLAYQGRLFAEEYADLPRPFIGIHLVQSETKTLDDLVAYLGKLQSVYTEATFFLCSTRRTDKALYERALHGLRDCFKDTGGRFPVVGFDYRFHAEHYDKADFWNLYQGLLDQADHLIKLGSSLSIISECLSTGKMVHILDPYRAQSGVTIKLDLHAEPRPLETPRVPPVDITGDCADALIRKHADHKAGRVVSLKRASTQRPRYVEF